MTYENQFPNLARYFTSEGAPTELTQSMKEPEHFSIITKRQPIRPQEVEDLYKLKKNVAETEIRNISKGSRIEVLSALEEVAGFVKRYEKGNKEYFLEELDVIKSYLTKPVIKEIDEESYTRLMRHPPIN